jgi:hypothetical protein
MSEEHHAAEAPPAVPLPDRETIEVKLDRLTHLVGTDQGFYVLALHSFVEYWLRYKKGYGQGPSFGDLTWTFREELQSAHGDTSIPGISCLAGLGRQHALTGSVRHAFESLDSEEAVAATHLFLAFCRLVGLHQDSALGTLEKHLDAWKNRAPLVEQAGMIRTMQAEIAKLSARNKELLAQRAELADLGARLEDVQRQLAAASRAAAEARSLADRRHGRLDELRRERNALEQERTGLRARMVEYEQLERYLRYLGRLSVYTQTRLDYERSLAQLTPEQDEAAAGVRLSGTYLVRGGPGTGKSLVLLEALRRAALQHALDFGQGESVVLVTFTRTLVKYNRYIAELMGLDLPLEVVATVDTLLLRKLQAIEPEARYDFDLLDRIVAPERTPLFLTVEELRGEIEGLLFGWALTRQEYVEEIILREGMRHRLTRRQREEVWAIRDEVVAEMEATHVYTTGYGRLRLLEHLQKHPQDRALRDISHLFVDEAQDLTPAALQILRELTRGGIVMAGDPDQSLYNAASPFARAGLSMRGSTRVLRTSFRNTAQIHALAERFRERSAHLGWEGETRPFAFREGPVPELILAGDAEEARALLAEKLRVFLDVGYEPENVCILVPRNLEIAPMLERLAALGLAGIDITDAPFTFYDRGRVRLSTLHSSKGLDFPVVLLYLPYLPRRPHLDETQSDRLVRNLLYVGITRAMDNLNVFAVEAAAASDPLIGALAAAFGLEAHPPR